MAAREFSVSLQEFVKHATANVNEVVYRTIQTAAEKVIARSPVGNAELWAANDVTMMNREMLQVFREDQGKKRFTSRTLKKHFPLKSGKGYVGGRFRANWQYGEGSPPSGELFDTTDSSFRGGNETLAAVVDKVNVNPVGKVHYISNNLPYAQRLEDGWSKQCPPSGMVGLTMVELVSEVERITREVNT